MFDIPLPFCFFTKEHPLKTPNKGTQIPLLINQFVSLVEPICFLSFLSVTVDKLLFNLLRVNLK